MCEIWACTKKLPSLESMKTVLKYNSDGMGVAWFGKNGRPHFKKDFPFNDVMPLWDFIHSKELPLPLMIHMRNKTIGEAIPELAHPFPISLTMPETLEGEANAVLCHNGTWELWETEIKEMVLGINSYVKKRRNRLVLPGGKWSDSRAIAWAAAAAGIGYLQTELKDKKIAIMSTDKPGQISIIGGKLWHEFDGFLMSCLVDDFKKRKEEIAQENWNKFYKSESSSSCHVGTGLYNKDNWFQIPGGGKIWDPTGEKRRAQGRLDAAWALGKKAKPIPSWTEDYNGEEIVHQGTCMCQLCEAKKRLAEQNRAIEIIGPDGSKSTQLAVTQSVDQGADEYFTREELAKMTQEVCQERKRKGKLKVRF
jgi:hypothetical protein